MKSWMAKAEDVEKKWWLVDASGQTLGRVATQIATVLRGKHKPEFTNHVDCGDFVVVINTDELKLSGGKWQDKHYYWHTGFFGGINDLSAQQLQQKNSPELIKKAVSGMLPKNRLARQMIKKLKAYSGTEHPHSAQKPQALNMEQ